MRQLAYLGVAALTAVALIGTSCSSDKSNNNGGTGGDMSAGGQANTGGSTSTASTGGSSAGGSNTGGATSAGGQTSSCTATALTTGLALDGNYLTIGSLKGVAWTTWDTKVSGEPGSTIAQVPGKMCACGVAAKVLCQDGSTSDCAYSTYWGVDLGWNLNQPKDADGGALDPVPADLSGYTSVTVNFDGVSDPILPLRIQLTVPDPATGTEAYYCWPIATKALPQTIPLNSLITNCWAGGSPQVPFDPATMKPSNLVFQVYTDISAAHPFNFCLTELTFNTN